MAEPHVVAALKDKRAELSGSIADLEKRIGQHRADLLHADLLHVDAVLRLFAPELAPSTILPRAVRRPNSWFKPNDTATTEIYTLSLHDALRSRWSPYHFSFLYLIYSSISSTILLPQKILFNPDSYQVQIRRLNISYKQKTLHPGVLS